MQRKSGADTVTSWWHVSDSHATPVTESAVLKAQAYLLFYTREASSSEG